MSKIDGVLLTPLKIIRDERGNVMHFLKQGREPFVRLNEVYFSTMNPRVTKGWKQHDTNTSNMAVIQGVMRFWVRDERDGSSTKGMTETYELAPEEGKYHLLTVPPGVVYAWSSVGDGPAVVCNGTPDAWEAAENRNLPLETWPLT